MAVTIGQTEGNGDAPFVPSEEWIEAFEAQATDELYERLKRFAGMRGRMVAHSGRYVDDYYVRELVQDAFDDTFAGVLRWDPARCSLELHLRGAIKSRSRHDFRHGKDYRHARLDPDDPSRATLRLAETALAEEAATAEKLRDVSERVLDELEILAGPDTDGMTLIGVYRKRISKKVDVMAETGWSSKRYEATRKRLTRLVKQLPDVREAFRVRA